MLIVNCITKSCIWNTCVSWQGTDYRLPTVETCRSVILYGIFVHLLVLLKNKKKIVQNVGMKFVTLHYSVHTCLWKWANNFRCNLSTNRSELSAIMACPAILLSSSVGSSRPNCFYFVRNIPVLLKSLIISIKRRICMSWPFGVTMVKFFSCLVCRGQRRSRGQIHLFREHCTCHVTHYVLLYLQRTTILFLT
jgi:hypothetical protein